MDVSALGLRMGTMPYEMKAHRDAEDRDAFGPDLVKSGLIGEPFQMEVRGPFLRWSLLRAPPAGTKLRSPLVTFTVRPVTSEIFSSLARMSKSETE